MNEKACPYVCGKCLSNRLYREDDRLNGCVFIACQVCGNRYPGGPEPVYNSIGDVFLGTDLKSVPKGDAANQLVVDNKLTEENDMEPTQKDAKGRFLKVCTNCRELKPHHGRGLCAKCYSAQVAYAPIAKKPCANCLRIMPLQGYGLCGGCRSAARRLKGAARDLALDNARLRFNAPDYKPHPGRRATTKPAPVENPAGLVADNKSNGEVSEVTPGSAAPQCGAPAVPTVIPAQAGVQETPTARIGISFPETDRNLKVWGYLCAEADRNRRSPEAQMLWVLETLMESEA